MIIKVHTTKGSLKNARAMTAGEMAKLNTRLRKAMQVEIRENQKKQMLSMKKASELVLNA